MADMANQPNRIEDAMRHLAAVEPDVGASLAGSLTPSTNRLEGALRRLAVVEPDLGAEVVVAISPKSGQAE